MMELLDNDMVKWLPNLSEIRARFERRHHAGCTLVIGEDMVKYPSRFIVYCMSRLPITNIILDGSKKEWTVIDGNKRLRTIINFIDGKFPLDDGTYFKDIPGHLKFVLTTSLNIEAYFITSGAKDRETIIKYIKEE